MREILGDRPFEATKKLVEPTQQVVRAAMKRVREGDVDTLGRQGLMLRNRRTDKLYEVIDVRVRQTPDGVESTGDLDSGLFVKELKIGKHGSPNSNGLDIQIPRYPNGVTPENIDYLTEIKPKTMTRLAEELTKAKIYPS